MTAQAVQAARAQSLRQLEQVEQQRALTGQWLAFLEQTPAALAARLLTCINVVAATLTGLSRDSQFGDSANAALAPVRFALLVLEEADPVTAAGVLRVARCGP